MVRRQRETVAETQPGHPLSCTPRPLSTFHRTSSSLTSAVTCGDQPRARAQRRPREGDHTPAHLGGTSGKSHNPPPTPKPGFPHLSLWGDLKKHLPHKVVVRI